jgi:hypothetical protein
MVQFDSSICIIEPASRAIRLRYTQTESAHIRPLEGPETSSSQPGGEGRLDKAKRGQIRFCLGGPVIEKLSKTPLPGLPITAWSLVDGSPQACIELGNERGMGMTRAIVDQKLSALLSAEARLDRTLRESPSFDEIWASYRKVEDEYNDAFDAWCHS